MSKLALYACIVAAAACTKNESRLDKVPPASAEAAPGVATGGTSQGGTSADARLARVERRLDKVISILQQALPPDAPDPSTVYSVPISPSDPAEGPADAKVTIVEAFEFMCPYCYMVNPTIDKILAKYPKDVRVVGKYMVIHGQPAAQAAQLACAAHKQGKYTPVKAALWEALFKLENNRPAMKSENANLDAMKQVAVAAGADAARLDADMEGCKSWIAESTQSLRPLGVNGTPSFFINGRFLQAMDLEQFDVLIKEELAKADKAIADGVAQGDYYQRQIVAKGEKKAKGRFED
jgi:protein-disulfide isomerase